MIAKKSKNTRSYIVLNKFKKHAWQHAIQKKKNAMAYKLYVSRVPKDFKGAYT